MKISGLEHKDNSKILSNKRFVTGNKDNFLKEMESNLFNKSRKNLKDLLSSIRKKGDDIIITKSHSDVLEYKNLVKQYLKKVMEDMYELNKFSDTFSSRYYLIVETIDGRLKELTDKVLSGEKDNIDILNTIDEIQGLIVDVYK